MPATIWINGTFHARDTAVISVYDHGLLYGDGVFEGMRTYGGKVFRLDEHLDRLWASAKAIALEPDRLQGYDTRASVLVGLGRHSDAVAAYRDMESRFDLEFTREIFTEDPTFEKFVASKEFRAWLPR